MFGTSEWLQVGLTSGDACPHGGLQFLEVHLRPVHCLFKFLNSALGSLFVHFAERSLLTYKFEVRVLDYVLYLPRLEVLFIAPGLALLARLNGWRRVAT